MDTENDYGSQKTKNSVIVFNENLYIENDNEKPLIQNNENDYSTVMYYICTCIISILMFTLCAWGSQISFTEIIDLELPIVILFTLILTAFNLEGYAKISYVIYIIASCIIYLINPSFAFYLIISITSNIIVKFIELILNNKSDYPNKYEKTEGNIVLEHIHRIRYYILLSFILFVIFLVLGYYYAGVFQPLVLPSVQGLHEGVQQGTVKLETIALFINNFTVASNMILGGLYFSVTTLYLLVFNALVVGFSGSTMDVYYFLAFTLPHGIIELFAIILAGAAGFRITHAILFILKGIRIKDENKTEIFNNHLEIAIKMLFDVVFIIIIIALLLIIAAYIEANLTIPIGNSLMQNYI